MEPTEGANEGSYLVNIYYLFIYYLLCAGILVDTGEKQGVI